MAGSNDTITGIMGEFGLPSNSNSSAISDLEKSILASSKPLINELRSTGQERLTGQGLGISSFGDQALKKQETDILGQITTNIAGLKFGEHSKDTEFARDIARLREQGDVSLVLEKGKIDATGQASSIADIEGLFTNSLLDQINLASGGDEAPFLLPLLSAFQELPNLKNSGASFNDAIMNLGTTYTGLQGLDWFKNLFNSDDNSGDIVNNLFSADDLNAKENR